MDASGTQTKRVSGTKKKQLLSASASRRRFFPPIVAGGWDAVGLSQIPLFLSLFASSPRLSTGFFSSGELPIWESHPPTKQKIT